MFSRVILAGLTIAAVAAVPVQAFGYCSEPSAPSFYGHKPSEPHKPFCINEISRTHSCSDWEIDRYNDEVERYNSDLRSYLDDVDRYIDKLNDYVRDAVEYAECEVGNL